MSDREKKGILSFLPSVADVVFIILLFSLLASDANLLGDADTGYHIRAGEYIIQNREIPHHDIFSHMTPPLKWTAHEWLSEVIFAFIHGAAGLTGLVVLTAVLIASTLVVLFRFLKCSVVNIVSAAVVIALAAGASTIHWLARPHIFSLLFTLLWYMSLEVHQKGEKKYLFALPLMMVPWVNLHGGFMAGFMLLGVYLIGNILRSIFLKEGRLEGIMRTKRLLMILVLCLFAAFLNPKGPEILLFPFKLTTNAYIMDHVNEFLSPNFHSAVRFEYMLLFMILALGVSVLRLSIIEMVLVLLFTHMSLYSARYIPLFAIIVSPIVAKRLDGILYEVKEQRVVRRFCAFADRVAATDSATRFPLWSLLAAAVVVSLLLMGRLDYGFDRKKLPVDAVDFVMREGIQGNMFNNDEFGDYIIYRAWPTYRVFFDGRSDMYGTDRMKEYFRIAGVKQGWEDVLRKYDVKWIMFNNDSSLCIFLMERDDWKLVYADRVANIFVRNIPEYRALIAKYPDVKPVKGDEEKK